MPNNAKKTHPVAWIASLGCVFAQFTPYYVWDYPINGSFFALVLLLVYSLTMPLAVESRHILVALVVWNICTIKLIGSGQIDESFKAFAQITLAAVFLILFLNRSMISRFDAEQFTKVFGTLMSLHAILLIVQFVAMNFFGVFEFQNPFGEFSPFGPLGGVGAERSPYLPNPMAELKRPNGFFSEPSVAGAMSAFAMAVTLSNRTYGLSRKLAMAAVLAIGVFVTFALTGWIMGLSIGIAYVLFAKRISGSSKAAMIALFILVFTGMAIVGADYLTSRIESAGESRTSIYMRFSAPIMLTFDTLSYNLFGLPINDSTFIQGRSYMVDFAGRNFTTIDNFYFWLIVYFGILGVAGIVLALRYVLLSVYRLREPALPLLMIAFFAGATGAGYSPYFILPLAIAMALTKVGSTQSVSRPNTRGNGSRPRKHIQRRVAPGYGAARRSNFDGAEAP